MTRGIRPEPAEIAPDRRTDGKRSRRFRMRIRDWLIAVVLVALVAAGVAEVIRARRLQVERELAEAIRSQEKAIRLREALKAARDREAVKKAGEWLKKAKTEGMEIPQRDRDGIFPDRKGLPDSGRTVL